jgi:hypothetical protein
MPPSRAAAAERVIVETIPPWSARAWQFRDRLAGGTGGTVEIAMD